MGLAIVLAKGKEIPMNRIQVFRFAILVGLAISVANTTYATPRTATGRIRFFGTSTLHDFAGELATGPFVLDVSRDSDKQLTVVGASLSVAVKGMTTHHTKRDLNMYKMFEAGPVPFITGFASNVVIAADGTAEVPLVLTLGSRQETLTAQLRGWSDTDGELSGTLSFVVSLSGFGLKAPSVMGLIRVGDQVRVECELIAPSASNVVAMPVASKE
jgi:hypothetical protein